MPSLQLFTVTRPMPMALRMAMKLRRLIPTAAIRSPDSGSHRFRVWLPARPFRAILQGRPRQVLRGDITVSAKLLEKQKGKADETVGRVVPQGVHRRHSSTSEDAGPK